MRMKDPQKYYEVTKNNNPSALIKRFFKNRYNEKLEGNVAVDIGCGAGNDTAFLLEKGFNVIAIDQEENIREVFREKNLESKNLKIVIDDFSKIEIPEADLLLANYSLFFVKDNFDLFIKNILKGIKTNGFFVGNFLGKEDDWNINKTTVDKNELMDYFKEYNMLYFAEEKYYKDTVNKNNKFWHVYTIIAYKK